MAVDKCYPQNRYVSRVWGILKSVDSKAMVKSLYDRGCVTLLP
jgi:hypothetical protein